MTIIKTASSAARSRKISKTINLEKKEDDNINHEASISRDDNKPSKEVETLELKALKSSSAEEIIELAKEYNLENVSELGKQDLIYQILKSFSMKNYYNVIIGEGVLEILADGFGFLRTNETNYQQGSDDIYVSPNQIKRFGLRTGDVITGQVRAPKKGERYFALLKVSKINHADIELAKNRILFDDLTPLYPKERLNLEIEGAKSNNLSARLIDLTSPLGKGQRALIVAPPRTGKTYLMQNIARSITTNHPEVTLMVLLIDERPEEVTDMRRSVKGEVVSSTFDESAIRHVQLAEMVI